MSAVLWSSTDQTEPPPPPYPKRGDVWRRHALDNREIPGWVRTEHPYVWVYEYKETP